MKSKIFVAALATLSLAACNNEELLTSEGALQNSSVVFNVTMDDDAASRAGWGGTNGYTLQWLAEDADRLSFFHGATQTVGSVLGAQNAIYKAESVGAEGVKFTTHSMINPGWGVMVYPCDTTFFYASEGKLYVEIPAAQTAESNKLLPFVSNVINIAAFDANKGDGAGYAKEYDIALKQVGTQFTMNVDWNGETLNKITALSEAGTILPINVVASQLYRQENFQRSAEIIILDQTPVYAAEGRDSWVKVTKGNEATSRFLDNTLTTKDIKDLSTSEFTLLPTSGATTNADAHVKIYTRYGSVTIGNTAGKVWHKATQLDADTWKTIPQGIQELVDLTLNEKDDEESKFDNERVGGHVTRHIAADLENLNMSDVCIINDKHLHDIILVHDALQEDVPVTFKINGDEDGVFEMSMATLNMLKARPEIKITPCTVAGEECTAIRLTGATEVPEFAFLTTGANLTVKLANEATPWTWTGDNKAIANISAFVNEGTLNVAAGSELGGVAYAYGMTNSGTMNINGLVKQNGSDMYNTGTINIAVGAEYIAYGSGRFIENVSWGAEEGESGKIFNSGILTTSMEGEIRNYGYIENMIGGTANMTYITTNETATADFSSEYAFASNKFGTIMLKNVDDNISISNSTEVGFIKYKYTGTEYVTPAKCKYNYIIVENHDIAFTAEDDTKFAEVKFLEVTSEGNNIPVITQDKHRLNKLRGFILEGKANIQENNLLIVPAAYVKGTLYLGGEFRVAGGVGLPKTEDVYFGDSDVDYLRKY